MSQARPADAGRDDVTHPGPQLATYFISDLHLDASRPQLTAILLRFLARIRGEADALYVLGDLFESWVGDDAVDALASEVAQGMQALAASSVPIAFLCGNRDFLLGAEYAQRCAMRRLPDPTVIDLYGRPALLSHGDALCTADLAYQAFRRQVRDPQWQAAFLARPLVERQEYAARARTASAAHQAGGATAIGDVDPASVDSLFAQFGVDLLIHGHTHRPATHTHAIGETECTRIVLADWRDRGEALRVDRASVTRIRLD